MKTKNTFSSFFQEHSTLFILIVPLLLAAVITYFAGSMLFQRIVLATYINLILVLGLQIFMGNSGILSFSHIGFMGIGAYASVLFSMTPQAKMAALPELYPILQDVQLPFVMALLVGAILAALVAAVLGYPLMRLSDAAAVITMFGMLVIIHVVLVHWSQVTNGPRTLFGIDNLTTYWVAVIFAILAVILAYWFRESALGLKLRASRDDRYAAGSIGINIVIVRWLGFILSAFIAGFAGGLWAHFITSFSPSAFYLAETFTILAMLVVGGTGSVTGAVVGTFSVTLVREALRALENGINSSATSSIEVFGLTEVALSIALILILILRPGGVFGSQEARWANGKTLPAEENGASSGN